MPLTEMKVKSLKPRSKPYKVSDYDSLFVLVTPSGSRLWKFKFRIDGKEKLLSFGKFPEVSLKQARTKRDEARSKLAEGRDPAAEKQMAKRAKKAASGNTFAELSERFLQKQAAEGLSETTLSKKRWLLQLAESDLGKTPITDISAQDVLKTLKKREELGHHETVRRMRSTISAVFRYAVALGAAEFDPTSALRDALIKPTVKHHAAITDTNTLEEFFKALEAYGGQAETIIGIKLLLLFASRPGEIRQARWDEFDLEGRIWRVPAERMKMRKSHDVPLADAAIRCLSELHSMTGWGELLFPSQRSSKKPISENTFTQALRRMGFGPDEVTAHGFRTTFSTLSNESGLWNPDVIESYLSHQDRNAIRRTYNRASYWDERVKLADWWADYLQGYGLETSFIDG